MRRVTTTTTTLKVLPAQALTARKAVAVDVAVTDLEAEAVLALVTVDQAITVLVDTIALLMMDLVADLVASTLTQLHLLRAPAVVLTAMALEATAIPADLEDDHPGIAMVPSADHATCAP